MAHISLRQLDAFIAVADTKNFNRAAENLYLSSSTISNLIAELEDRLEFPLFERTTRKVSLSPRGREFLPYAISVMRQLKVAEAAAVELKNNNVSMVRVAAPQVVASTFLPKVISQYELLQPDVRIRIVDSSVMSLSDQVVTGTADIAIGPEQAVAKGISATPLFESRWVIWCHPDHPIANKKEVRWSELSAYRICAAGSDHERSLAPVINGLPPNQRFQISSIVDSVTTALGMVAENLSITMTPEYVENLGMFNNLVKRPLIEPDLYRSYVLYFQTDLWNPQLVKDFSDFIQVYLKTSDITQQ